ncbi:MAG: Uncharacterised protein [Formosa sp. Hel1_33_131]|nr:MAG: Uncharacterised protein [Formosa sp. Hel1_33_131]
MFIHNSWHQLKKQHEKFLAIAILLITTQNLISQTAEELNSKEIELAKKGKIEKDFSIFEKAIKFYPDSPGPYSNRGMFIECVKNMNLP